VARRQPHAVPAGSRLARAWIAALGVLLVPLVAFLVFAILNARPVREFRDRIRSAGYAASPESSTAEPVAAVPEPAVTDPLGLQPSSSPSMTPAFVESTAGAAKLGEEATPAAPAPATPARPAGKPHRDESEPVAVARANLPAAVTGTVRRQTPAVTSWTPPPTTEMGLVCGEVRDFEGRPVAGAQVEVSEALVVVADGAGRFCMSAPAGDRTLTVRAPGFVAQQSALRVGPQTPQQVVTLATLRR
jgi:hypothetical protein